MPGLKQDRFAEDVTTADIKKRIEGLLDHKVVREIDGLLKELKSRKALARGICFIEKIRDEMCYD